MEEGAIPQPSSSSGSQPVAHVNHGLDLLSLGGATQKKGGQQRVKGTQPARKAPGPRKAVPDTVPNSKPSRVSGKHSTGKRQPQPRSSNSLTTSPLDDHTACDFRYLKSPLEAGPHFSRVQGLASRIPVPSSSSSSSSSAWTPPDCRTRAFSDPERVSLVPDVVKSRHAAHRCSRSGSESTSTPSAGYRSLCTPSSTAFSLDTSHSIRGGHAASVASSQKQKNKGRNLKYEAYMPLCEVQQALKKGEVLEGVLRINPRNYEDSFISAPDSQMDIYIGGQHDRNRALNGDIVAVWVKPQAEWKIHWDKIHMWEQQTNRSILEVLDPEWEARKSIRDHPTSGQTCRGSSADRLESQQGFPEGPKADAPGDDDASSGLEGNKEGGYEAHGDGVEDEDADFFSDSPPLSPESNWDGLSHVPGVRPSDTIEVLGIERLLGQVQEYVDREKESRRSRSSRARVAVPCSLEATLTPIPPSGSQFSDFGQRTNIAAALGDPHPQPQEAADPWAVNDDNGTTVVFSPEELLEVPEEELEACRRNKGRRVVAPDELSGEEDWNEQSLSDAESVSSLALEQRIEDMEFLRAAQDARNNNVLDDVAVLRDPADVQPPLGDASANDAPPSGVREVVCAQTPSATDLVGDPAGEDIMQRTVTDGDIRTFRVPGADAEVPDIVAEEEGCDDGKSKGRSKWRLSKQGESNDKKGEAKLGKKKNKGKVKGEKKEKRKKQGDKPQTQTSASAGTTSTARLRAESKYEQLVVEDIMKHPLWNRFVQKTGKVVHILESKNSRVTAGHLRLLHDNNPAWVLFSPRDSRFPRMMIPSQECPQGFFERPGEFVDTLFLAELTEWQPESALARGKLRKLLGKTGDASVETEAILESYSVDYGEFPEDVFGDLDVSENWVVPESELAKRRDFRGHLVFTIDPKTARDLDDAVSCRRVGDLWEVGVHIADVSYFIKEGTHLDTIAKKRATSVYFVQMVVPMLPRLLCDNLCSLHPGEDKLTFSVVWKMTDEGKIIDEWFGRSVIRSCCKLSYEHAQDMMDSRKEEYEPGVLPAIHDGHTAKEVMEAVCTLQRFARALRKKRFENGALRLDQLKVVFALNESSYPVGFSLYEHTESHQLIEELMLLANMAVAHKLYRMYPEKAFLRRHPPPDDAQLYEVVAMCEAHGIHLDATSAGTLQESMNKLAGIEDSRAIICVLTNLLSKPMRMAQYFCAGTQDDPEMFAHYALNVPLYTHFTSPIRRYADIVVHRLLAAAVGYVPPPSMKPKELQKVAMHCNDKKTNARLAQELSVELFLYVFIRQCRKFEDRGMVTGVLEHAFDVLSLSVGIIKRVYCDKLGTKSFSHFKDRGKNCIELRYLSKDGEEVVDTITAFKTVDIVIVALPDVLKYQVVLKPPANATLLPREKSEKQKEKKVGN